MAPSLDEAAWLRQALERRPELMALRWELSALGDERALALWGPWQDAAIGANVQRAPTWVGGPVLTVPLPVFDDGSAAAAGVDAAQAEVRHRLTGAMRDAIEAVRAAFAAFAAHRADLARVQRQLLPALEQERQRALAAERLGEGDAVGSLRAEIAVSAAQEAALDRERDAMLALLRLERAAAGLPPSGDAARAVADAAGEAP